MSFSPFINQYKEYRIDTKNVKTMANDWIRKLGEMLVQCCYTLSSSFIKLTIDILDMVFFNKSQSPDVKLFDLPSQSVTEESNEKEKMNYDEKVSPEGTKKKNLDVFNLVPGRYET